MYLSQLSRCTQHQACLSSVALLVTWSWLPLGRVTYCLRAATPPCAQSLCARNSVHLICWRRKEITSPRLSDNSGSQSPRRQFCVYAQRLRVDVKIDRGLTSCPLRIGDGYPLRARTPVFVVGRTPGTLQLFESATLARFWLGPTSTYLDPLLQRPSLARCMSEVGKRCLLGWTHARPTDMLGSLDELHCRVFLI